MRPAVCHITHHAADQSTCRSAAVRRSHWADEPASHLNHSSQFVCADVATIYFYASNQLAEARLGLTRILAAVKKSVATSASHFVCL